MTGTIEVSATPARTLNWKETKRLQEMNLAPKVEKVVRAIWEAGPENKGSGSWLFSLLGFFLTPGIIAVFILSTMQKEIGVRLDNVAFAAVWILFIFFMGLVAMMYAAILVSRERKVVLGQMPLSIWSSKTGKLRRFYGRFNTIVLLCVLAYCGHIFTAVVFFLIWFVVLCETQAVKQKVQHEVDQIEREY